MTINKELLNQAMNYDAYEALIDKLLLEGKSTSGDQEQSMLGYTRLNQQRSRKWNKIVNINKLLSEALEKVPYEMVWLVLTEGWCGDAAQNLPVINKMADISDKIELKILLRDQHLDLMDAYLTNGGRAIPKLIFLRKSDLQELAVWGPRPAPLQKMMHDYKSNGADPAIDIYQQMHLWYSRDKGETLQTEFLSLLNNVS